MKRLVVFIFTIITAVLIFSAMHSASATVNGDAPGRTQPRLETTFPSIVIGGDPLTPAAGPAQFVQYIFVLGLGLGGILAFAMIVFAGLEWSLSGASPSLQQDAKDRIFNAVFGLLLLMGAFVILNTINPDLIRLRVEGFRELKERIPSPTKLEVPRVPTPPPPLPLEERIRQNPDQWADPWGTRWQDPLLIRRQ